MVVSDTTVLIGIGLIFIYLVVYRKNNLFGNLGYMGISLGVWYFTTTSTGKVVGLVMFFGSVINTVYDMVMTRKKN